MHTGTLLTPENKLISPSGAGLIPLASCSDRCGGWPSTAHWLAGHMPAPARRPITALELISAGEDTLLMTARRLSQEQQTEGHVIH